MRTDYIIAARLTRQLDLHRYGDRCMIFHMKTTLNIPESLMKELKKRAAETGQNLSETLADVLQKGLQPQRAKGKLRKLPVYDCGKVYVNVADRDQLYRAMEGR